MEIFLLSLANFLTCHLVFSAQKLSTSELYVDAACMRLFPVSIISPFNESGRKTSKAAFVFS